MKTRRLLCTPVVLALLLGAVGSLLWRGTPALAAAPASNLIVPIVGTLDGLPESVSLTGQAQIRSTLVSDPDFGTPPSVNLSIRLLNMSGVGLSTGARYVAKGEIGVMRLLVPSGVVEVTFPFTPVGATGIASARSGLATFTLTFDINNGSLKGATASLSSPNFAN